MTCTAIAILAALGGAAFGFTVSNILFAGRRADEPHRDLAEIEVVIATAGDGFRIWVNGPAGNIARWYRIGRVTVDDRRLPRVVG